MEKDQCDSCFDDITKKVDQVVNATKNLIVKMNYEHTIALEKHEIKSIEFFEKESQLNKETRESLVSTVKWFLGIALSIIAFSLSITGYTWLAMNEKADEKEVVKRTEFEMVIQQGDEYNRNVFVKQAEIKEDTFTYTSNKNLIFQNGLRGVKSIN